MVDFFEKIPRKDRIPMNTPKNVSDALDRGFQKNFGWKPRTEGVFCTPDITSASFYGDAYLFFPFDEYKYIWSPDVEDLYSDLPDISKPYLENSLINKNTMTIRTHINKMSDKELDALVKYIFNVCKYTDKNLKYNKENEVMVKCKKYYMLSLRRYRIDGYDFFESAN